MTPSAPVISTPRMLLSATVASTICTAATEPTVMPFLPLRHEYCRWKREILNWLVADTAPHGSPDLG